MPGASNPPRREQGWSALGHPRPVRDAVAHVEATNRIAEMRKASLSVTDMTAAISLGVMKMTDALEKAFNHQVTREFEASMVYRQLAIALDEMDLPGMAAWLRHQADEEIVHANKLIDHLGDRGNHARIGNIAAAELEVTSALQAFEFALAHEQKVSQAIRDLFRESENNDDLDSRPLLSWFLSEQIEEEATVSQIIGRLKFIDGDGPGLLRLDAELGARPVKTTEV